MASTVTSIAPRCLHATFAAQFILICALVLGTIAATAQELKIYFLDVDGGQATLVVAENGASMLVDAAWPGFEGRDTEKILAAAKDAGIHQLNIMLTTHYHTDHVGGVPQLAKRIPIKRFIDHGENTEQSANTSRLYQAYLEARAHGEHQQVKAGDSFALGAAKIRVVSARKQLLTQPLKAPGAGVRPAGCDQATQKKGDGSENEMSIGTVLEFGRFRMLNLADLLWNEELALVCPVNKLGDIDVLLTSHHGFGASNNPVMIEAVRPRVAVMNNGARKGGDPERWNAVRDMPSIESRWQTQKSDAGDGSHNVADDYIASMEPSTQPAWIKVVARRDGSFTVSNSRNQFAKHYAPRK